MVPNTKMSSDGKSQSIKTQSAFKKGGVRWRNSKCIINNIIGSSIHYQQVYDVVKDVQQNSAQL